jgi:uncharacterized repeat protein (TIGR02543 family)
MTPEFPQNSEELTEQKDSYPSLALVAKDKTTVYLQSKDADTPFDFSEWLNSWADFFAYSDATYLGRYYIQADESGRPYFTGSDLTRLTYEEHQLALFAVDGSKEAYGTWQNESPSVEPEPKPEPAPEPGPTPTPEPAPEVKPEITPTPDPAPTAKAKTGKLTVRFNANGGKATRTKLEITEGKTIGKLPAAKRAKYSFKGWYTKKSGGKKVTSKTKLAKGVTLYARWKAKQLYGKVVNTSLVYVRAWPSLHEDVNRPPVIGKLKLGKTFRIRAFVDI